MSGADGRTAGWCRTAASVGRRAREAFCAEPAGGTRRAPLLTGRAAAAEEGQGLADWGKREAATTPPTETRYALRQREVQSKKTGWVQRASPTWARWGRGSGGEGT